MAIHNRQSDGIEQILNELPLSMKQRESLPEMSDEAFKKLDAQIKSYVPLKHSHSAPV